MSNSKYIISNNSSDMLHSHMSDSSLLCLVRIQNRIHNKHFVTHMLGVHWTTSVENILRQKMFS